MEYCGRLIDVIDEPKCVEVQRAGGGGDYILFYSQWALN